MCGIAGIIKKELKPQLLDLVNNSMAHRGPDANGIYKESDLGLVHRRLSIISPGQHSDQHFYSDYG